MRSSLKQSLILKALCYVLIPICIISIIVSIIYTAWLAENEDMKTANSVEETNAFADNYISDMYNMIENIENRRYYFSKYTDSIYMAHSYYRSSDVIKFVVVDKDTGIAYTNLDLTGNIYIIDDLKEKLLEDNAKYCNYNCETKQLDTNINNMRISKLTLSYLSESLEKHPSFEIYTVANESKSIYNEYYIQKIAFDICKTLGDLPIIMIPFLIVLTIVMSVYLLLSVGHKRDYTGIYLNRFDKLPIEITSIITIMALISIFMIFSYVFNANDSYNVTTNIIFLIIEISMLTILYALTALISTTVIKKIKSHTLWKSSLICKFINSIQRMLKAITYNIDTNIKIIVAFIGTILLSIILISIGEIFILVVLMFWAFILYGIIKKVNEFKKIKEALEKIYKGKTDIVLKEDDFKGDLKEISKYINDIQSGFSNAINEKLKSERMKTELITNVSHDIKTPLTSIINYVDLLKTEEINNEKAKEYIGILERKITKVEKIN